MSEIQTDATQALADTKTEISNLETNAETGAKTVLVKVESAAKSFYERHLPAFAAIAGAVVGSLATIVKIKLL